jgi:hypothetical protein
MKILTVTSNDLGINYGPSIHFLELWNAIADRFPNIKVTGIYPSWTGKSPIIEPNFDCKPKRVKGRRIRQIFWDFKSAAAVIATDADVVYVRISSFHLLTLLALRLRKLPLAVEINGSALADGKSASRASIIRRIADFCEKGLIKRASITFSVTHELSEYAKRENANARHLHVENGVSNRFFVDGRSNLNRTRSPVCIYVGTFTAWDGAAQIPEIARHNPEVEFRMIGDGGLRAQIESEAPDNMRFFGWAPYSELPLHYADADCAIVLYEEERHRKIGSSPLKIREYLASHLPVFTTTAVGTEIIERFSVGARVSQDFPAAFKDFINSLDGYHEQYDRQYDAIVSEISWFSSADTTAKELMSFLSIDTEKLRRRWHF